MKGFESSRATSVIRWMSLILIIASAFNPNGFPWPVLAWASLAVAALAFLSLRARPSMSPLRIPPGETRAR